jgi:hypothetical protein
MEGNMEKISKEEAIKRIYTLLYIIPNDLLTLVYNYVEDKEKITPLSPDTNNITDEFEVSQALIPLKTAITMHVKIIEEYIKVLSEHTPTDDKRAIAKNNLPLVLSSIKDLKIFLNIP